MINQELIDFANYLADISSQIAIKYFRKDNLAKNKTDNSPVTIADNEIELAIRHEIIKKYPHHGIIGEEYNNHNQDSDYKWIIDPIDGTSSYVIGMPIFGTLISLTYRSESILGIINQPINHERWVGIKDKYSTFNNKNINCRKSDSIENSVLCTTSPHFFRGKDRNLFEIIAKKTKYQKYGGAFYGGDCYLFGLMALGHIDIILENGLKNYDFAALIPIIEEAGGIITDWQGNKLDLNTSSKILACGDKKVHKEILEILSI
jgi:inositol-phosphate phosphatase/L-galactose 1-phosphate phosphatase/histidinol-phosphatase